MRRALIAPSLLAADLARLDGAVRAVDGSADWVHVDVMDAHFVPDLTVGLPVVEALARVSALPLDCHLMIDDPDRWGPGYAEAGAATVTVHAEATRRPAALGADIRAAGARPGLAVKPGTPLRAVEDVLDAFDLLLVMTVEPGFGGQPMLAGAVRKVARARRLLDRRGLQLWLQVDGGVNAETIERCAEAGADVFVAGTAVYGAHDPAAAVSALRRQAEGHRTWPPGRPPGGQGVGRA